MPLVLAKLLAKILFLFDKDVMKTLGVAILLPLFFVVAMFMAPSVFLVSIPFAGPVEISYYQKAAKQVDEEMEYWEEERGEHDDPWETLDWQVLVAIDAVRLTQRFEKANEDEALELARMFKKQVWDTKTIYEWDAECECWVAVEIQYLRFVTLDEVLDELGISGEERELVLAYENFDMQLLQNVDENIEFEGDFSPVEGEFIWPIPGHYRISSKFGPRIHPVTKKNSYHKGVDVPAPRGTSVVAVKDGIVVSAGYSFAEGNVLVIRHSFGYSKYAHLDRFLVKVGQEVSAGQQIAKVGSTGFFTTGAHLHFEIKPANNPVDPLQYYK